MICSACQAAVPDGARFCPSCGTPVTSPSPGLLGYRGECAEARSLAQSSSRIISELGHTYGVATIKIFAATIEGLADRWETAEALLREAARASQSQSDTLGHAAAAAGLARALLEQGRDGVALEAAESLTATGDPFLDADICGVRARALAGSDPDLAVREAEHARATANVTDSTACQATAELDRAHVLSLAGNAEGATEAAAAAGWLFGEKGHLVGVRRAAGFLRAVREAL